MLEKEATVRLSVVPFLTVHPFHFWLNFRTVSLSSSLRLRSSSAKCPCGTKRKWSRIMAQPSSQVPSLSLVHPFHSPLFFRIVTSADMMCRPLQPLCESTTLGRPTTVTYLLRAIAVCRKRGKYVWTAKGIAVVNLNSPFIISLPEGVEMVKRELLGETRIEGKSAIQFSLPVVPKRETEFLAIEVVTAKVGFKFLLFPLMRPPLSSPPP